MAVVDVGVALLGLRLGGWGPIALVALLEGAVARQVGGTQRGEDDVERDVVAVVVVGRVGGGVAEAVVLCDVGAAAFACVEDLLEYADLEPEAPLAARAEAGGGDG